MFRNPRTVLRIHGEDLLNIREPEAEGAPVRISGRFFDEDGNLCLQINDNQVIGSTGHWDVESRGARVIIRRGPGDIALRIVLKPEGVIVERMKFFYRGIKIVGSSEWFELNGQRMSFAGDVDRPDVGLSVTGGADTPYYSVKQKRRTLVIRGKPGLDINIKGQGPPDTDIYFCGGAEKLTFNGTPDTTLNVGDPPLSAILGQGLSRDHAIFLTNGESECRLGAGCRSHTVRLISMDDQRKKTTKAQPLVLVRS